MLGAQNPARRNYGGLAVEILTSLSCPGQNASKVCGWRHSGSTSKLDFWSLLTSAEVGSGPKTLRAAAASGARKVPNVVSF